VSVASLRAWVARLLLVAFGLGAGVLLVEIVCQLYSLRVFRAWDESMRDPRFYYRRSEDPVLVYELVRDRDIVDGSRRMHVNRDGFREAGDRPFPQPVQIGVLGDSVTFGIGLTTARAPSEVLQEELDPKAERVKVFNFGVPGYALPQLAALLRRADAAYHPQTIVYLMNMNDFSMRETVTEGADNGLYRMFRRPALKLPWFVRKAVYRAHKGEDGKGSPEWIRWTYARGRDRGLPYLDAMNEEARRNRQRLLA
jgi:hypothetical protein